MRVPWVILFWCEILTVTSRDIKRVSYLVESPVRVFTFVRSRTPPLAVERIQSIQRQFKRRKSSTTCVQLVCKSNNVHVMFLFTLCGETIEAVNRTFNELNLIAWLFSGSIQYHGHSVKLRTRLRAFIFFNWIEWGNAHFLVKYIGWFLLEVLEQLEKKEI